MRKYYWRFLALVGVVLYTSGAVAQQTLRWEPTLDSAKRRAAQTDRLVLIHFRADWCGACRQMDQEVFSRPDVAAAVQAHYVPVKVNADYFPATRKQYGVTALPTDVVITPQGQQIEKIFGPLDASAYVNHLMRVATAARQRGAEAYVQIPGSPQNSPMEGAVAPGAAPGRQPSVAANDPDDRYADYFARQRQQAAPMNDRYGDPALSQGGPQPPPIAPQQHAQTQLPYAPPQQAWPPQPIMPPQHIQSQPPSAPPTQGSVGPPPAALGLQTPPAGFDPSPAIQPPMGQSPPVQPQTAQSPVVNPPLGLEGYCPVALTDNVTWAVGNRLWGARHRGRTYLFSGPEQQQRFLAEPDRYAPVLSGNDVVAAVEQGQQIPGHRKYGVFFAGKVYLFAGEDSLTKFSKTPGHYANLAARTMQAGIPQGQHVR